ncbi:MAG: FIST C-terminal domain-containing protein [Phycisphaerales bacterium]|nr:MAG: FIST C-terminal domain-containing protein [Phycisphaerales bacterium]
MIPASPPSATPLAVPAISGHLDTRTAGTELAESLYQSVGNQCDLVLMFASFHHCAAFKEAATTIRQTVNPTTMLGVTAEGILGDEEELEGLAGMSALALRLPGAQMQPWISTPRAPLRISQPEMIPEQIGLTEDFRAAIMLADPFSVPLTRLLPAMTNCRGPEKPVMIVGGAASGSSQPGQNVLMVDDQFINGGAVGVSLAGEIEIDCVVSQGCRPFGQPLVITRAEKNLIQELGGKPALAALSETANELPAEQRQLLSGGLLIGTVIDEYKDHFGRGDFLVRNVMGLDQKNGYVVAGDLPRVGQTIQFHVRDAETATEDLQLLLDGQQLKKKPFGALLFTCNGRGQRLFGERNHDISIIRQRLDQVPIAGFFAAGEIGPVGGRSFLHGHTAALALFRHPRSDGGP